MKSFLNNYEDPEWVFSEEEEEEVEQVKEDPKTDTETVEVTPEVANAIADSVVKNLNIDSRINAAVEKAVQGQVEKLEKTIDKNVHGGKVVINAFDDRPEVRMIRAIKALKNNNFAVVAKYNADNEEARTKAGYGNEGTSADGGYLIPPPDFEAEIDKLLPLYGVAFQDADVRQVTGNSVLTNKLGTNVSMYDTAEGAQKTGTKLVFSQQQVTLRKFAAIAPLTDELNDDSAVDFYNELIQGFAQERAFWSDKIVFSENGTTCKGILRTASVNVEPISGAASTMNWDDLMNAEAAVPTRAMANGKFYMDKSMWNIIRQSKDSQGRYQVVPFSNKATPWGTPVVLCDIMPKSTDVDSDGSTPLVLFGDLKRTRLYVKKGLVIDILREGTVHDSTGSAINLGEKDMTAVRAVTRMVSLVKFPEAYTVIGTGTVS